jgi:hypothetical protein
MAFLFTRRSSGSRFTSPPTLPRASLNLLSRLRPRTGPTADSTVYLLHSIKAQRQRCVFLSLLVSEVHSGCSLMLSPTVATSSTHGNTMGGRTMFPAFSCSGTTCTITAPPNSHVSPPGWHQLFILDGPTPSHSRWVRIGGDPASLGNWPNFPDFTLPGV